jgi:hypothetical protein
MKIAGALGALFAAAVLAPASHSATAGAAEPYFGTGVRERVAAEGRVRVLVSRKPGPEASGLEVVRSLSGGRLLTGWLTPGGLSRLGSDGATRAVVLDRVVRPAGQVGTAQIGADRLLAAGLTGAGRAIGIVDTGVDLYHPDLGGSASGPGRVAGGWNFADGNADVNDCDGHGTAVAGVAAGEQGVAPGASVVALKVFGARDGCAGAWASDVLAAVEWALDRRQELRLDVLNLSLADDRVRTDFCDAEDPVSSELFSRARAEGVAVVAASGNSGRAEALAWPACHADVVGVGMVYSSGQGPTSWNGGADCTDAVTGPDVVPCASNGGAALSLLAPGVRWVAPAAGGGRHTTFSGTSAAAPAAAASLLLARQVSLPRDPLLSADLLRLAGVPVTDARTGRTAPRIDIGAAYLSPSPVSGPCERTVPFGGGPEGTVCRAEVSALTGRISSLAVALSVDHPRHSGLRVFLTSPDGTTIRLLDGTRRPGSAFREVLGRTFPSDEPLSAFAGLPAAGTWTLRLEDDAGLGGGHVQSWALLIEPETPRTAGPPDAPTRLLPTVARSPGRHGAFFSTDVVLFNPSEEKAADVTLTFLPAGGGPGSVVAADVSLPPGTTRVLSDVVGNAFRTTGAGPVHVAAPEDVVVASRTDSTAAGGGSYGLLARGVSSTDAIGTPERSTWLVPVFRPGRSRVNVGVVEVAGSAVGLEIVVRDGVGAVKGTFPLDLEPFGSRQLNDVHDAVSVAPSAEDLIEVRVVSGPGRVVAWAAAVDNGSNDGLLVTGTRPRRDVFLPATAHSPGRFGSFFRTDLKLANPRSAPANVRVSYFPSKGTGIRQIVLTLGAWETRVIEDVLADLFEVGEEGAGALRLSVLGIAPGIVVSSRSYTEEETRSYGLAIEALDDAQAGPGERIALTFLASDLTTRTNLGFLETGDVETDVRVTLLDAEGGRLATRVFRLARLQAVQWNDVFAEMSASPKENASAIVEVLSGGSVIAHAIRVDNRTNDASFLPGLVLRASVPDLRSGR